MIISTKAPLKCTVVLSITQHTVFIAVHTICVLFLLVYKLSLKAPS